MIEKHMRKGQQTIPGINEQIRALKLKHAKEKKQIKSGLRFNEHVIKEYEKIIDKYKRWEARIPAMVYLLDMHADGRFEFIYISSASKKLLGLEPEDIVQDFRVLADLMDPDDLDNLIKGSLNSGSSLSEFKCEARFRIKENTRWFEFTSIPEPKYDGSVIWNGIMLDITKRKEVEEEFREERNLMLTLMDNIPDTIYFKDTGSRFLKVNKGYLKKFNISSENDILMKSDSDIFSSEHADEARNDEIRIIETGEPVINKVEKETSHSGKISWVSTTKIPLKDTSGKITGTFGLSRDITDWVLMKNIIDEERSLMSTIINTIPDNIFVKNLEGKFILNNSAHLHSLGINSQEQLKSKTEFDLLPYETAKDHSNDDRLVIESGNPLLNKEEKIFNGADQAGWQLTTKVPLRDKQNNIIGIAGISHNITELKQAEVALLTSETRLANAMKIAHLAHWEYDFAGDLFTFNDQFYSLFGTTAEYEGGYIMSSSNYVKRFIYSEDAAIIGKEIQNAIISKDPDLKGQFEHRIVYTDGKIGYVCTHYFIITNKKGNTVKGYGVVQDITDRIKREQEKNELEKQLMQRNTELENMIADLKNMQGTLVRTEKMASIGQLASGIAHEINNPLAYVSSSINRLNEYFENTLELLNKWQNLKLCGQDNEECSNGLKEINSFTNEIDFNFILKNYKRIFTSIHDGAQRIKKIVEGIRGFAHSSGTSFSEANINQAIEDTVTIVWNEIKYKAALNKNFTELPVVLCNIGEIKQVLVNLLVNAAHSIKEQGTISISTYPDNESVFIKIKDTGCGISEENLKRIFDPFFTTKKVGEGTGLGLWICSTIIEKHNGSLTVESSAGNGSTFIIRLPITQITEETKN